MENEIKEMNAKLDEVEKLVAQKNYGAAKEILLDYVEKAELVCQETETTKYYSFRNMMEFFCAVAKFKPTKNINWTAYQLSWVYNMLSYIAIEEKHYAKSREYSIKAISYNPLDPSLYFEKAESYKLEKDFENMFKATMEVYEFLYSSKELARFYRNLGFYFIEEEKLDVAFALYVVSLNFELTKMAFSEIEYIRHQLQNPNYKLTTEQVLDILSENNIPFGIKEENKNTMLNLTREKEVIEKQPSMIGYVNHELNLLSQSMKSVDELLMIGENPKITTEDIFDANKLILDEDDKLRIRMNIEYLKSQNIPYIEHMKTIPTNSSSNLRNKREIATRLLGDYVVATISTYLLDDKDNIPAVLEHMDQKLQIKSVLPDGDLNYIESLARKEHPIQELRERSWLYEVCAIYMWSLHLIDKPSSNSECDVNSIDKVFFGVNSFEELVDKCVLRDKKEILNFADLVSRYHWACREARMHKQELPQLNELVVQKQHSALDWILSWKLENVMKDKIDVNYEKGHFNFKFTMPTHLVFDQVNGGNQFNELFVLTSSDKLTVLTLLDLGKVEQNEVNNIYDMDVNAHEKHGWIIVNQNEVNGFKELIVKKVVPPVEMPVVALVKYYFVLNGHLVCLESLLENNLNYNNYNDLKLSNNIKITMDLLSSIEEMK